MTQLNLFNPIVRLAIPDNMFLSKRWVLPKSLSGNILTERFGFVKAFQATGFHIKNDALFCNIEFDTNSYGIDLSKNWQKYTFKLCAVPSRDQPFFSCVDAVICPL